MNIMQFALGVLQRKGYDTLAESEIPSIIPHMPMVAMSQTNWKRLPKEANTVSVVMISYNTWEITKKAVEQLLATTGVRLEVFVLDNASTDTSVLQLTRKYHLRKDQAAEDRLREVSEQELSNQLFASLHEDAGQIFSIRSATVGEHTLALLESRSNLGFGRANNVGSAIASGEYLLYLNSDAFVTPQTVTKLLRAYRQGNKLQATSMLHRTRQRLDNIGIVSALLYNQDGTLQIQGGSLPNLRNIFSWILFVDDLPLFNRYGNSYQHHLPQMSALAKQKVAKVGWVGGTAMMVSRACLQEIGGFDPNIFMYGEDVELCWRATKRHWDVAMANVGKVIHVGSASSGSRNAVLGEIQGLLYLWQKHRSSSETWLLRQILKTGIRLRIFLFGILRRYGRQRVYQEALALV